MLDLKKPCKGCPFLRGDAGPVRLGRERCSEVMHYAIDNPGKTFSCHATVDYDLSDDREESGPGPQEQQCAGAMIFSIKLGKMNQVTQILSRMGMLEHLDQTADVFESEEEMLASSFGGSDIQEHTHTWEPVQGWTGRYRCSGCKALGYKKIVNGLAKSSYIAPYTCSKKGCEQFATVRTRGRHFYCNDHRENNGSNY